MADFLDAGDPETAHKSLKDMPGYMTALGKVFRK